MEDLTGKQLGPYQIIQPMGQGGMASVFKAFQPSMDRYVALKVLPRHFAGDPKFIARFTREAKLIAKLEHPNILPVYDFGKSDDYTYLVMRLVEGGSLASLIKKRAPLSFADINKFISQTGDALDYAHSRGIIHRDVKPANILLDHMGNCLLTDFGVAKMTEVSGHLTQTGHVLGTPAYVSPEQGMGLDLDGRSDIYALGVILYQLVIGKLPFNAETPMALVIKHIHDPLPPPRQIVPNLPESIERIILKALAKNRDDRYARATEMAEALERAVSQMPGAGTELVLGQALDKSGKVLPTKTILMTAQGKPERFAVKKMAPVAGALLLAILALFFFYPRAETPPQHGENSAVSSPGPMATAEVPQVSPPAAPGSAQEAETAFAAHAPASSPGQFDMAGGPTLPGTGNQPGDGQAAAGESANDESGPQQEQQEEPSATGEPQLTENSTDNGQPPGLAPSPATDGAYHGAVISGKRKKRNTKTLTFSLDASPENKSVILNATNLSGVRPAPEKNNSLPLAYRGGKREFYLPVNEGDKAGKFYKFRFAEETGKLVGVVDLTGKAPGDGTFVGHFIAARNASFDFRKYDPFPDAAGGDTLTEARLTPAPAARTSRPVGAAELELSLDFSGRRDTASFSFAGRAPLTSEVSWQPGKQPALKFHYEEKNASYHLQADLYSDNEPTLETESLILLGSLTTEEKKDFYFIGKRYQVTMLITDYESISEPFGKWLGWAHPWRVTGSGDRQAFKGSAKTVLGALGSTKNKGGVITDEKSGQARIFTIEKIRREGKTWTALAGGDWHYMLARPDDSKTVLISTIEHTIFICLRKI